MPAALIVQLIVALGPSALGLIDKLIAKWETKGDVTAQEWADLRASGKQTAEDRMRVVLTQAGIPLDSPQAIALLALTV